jgi:hypothetical protein
MDEKTFITLTNKMDPPFSIIGKKDPVFKTRGIRKIQGLHSIATKKNILEKFVKEKNIFEFYSFSISGFSKVVRFAIDLFSDVGISISNIKSFKKIILINNLINQDISIQTKQTTSFSNNIILNLDLTIPIVKKINFDLAMLNELFLSAGLISRPRALIEIFPDAEISVQSKTLINSTIGVLLDESLLIQDLKSVKQFAINNSIDQDILFQLLSSLKTNIALLEEITIDGNPMIRELKKMLISQTNSISIAIAYQLTVVHTLNTHYPKTLSAMYGVSMADLTRSVI